jgi:outer membrane protein assembly factor BamD
LRKTKRFRAILIVLVVVSVAGLAGCAGKKKADTQEWNSLSNPQAAYEQSLAYLAAHDLRKARQLLEKIDMTSGDRSMEPLIRLAMADATFYAGDDLSLIDAKPLYEDFVVLYGDHERAPYAKLQAGACLLEQVNHPSKDQAMTWEAIQELQGVIRRYPESPYSRLAQVKIDSARTNLAEHDFLIGMFYLKKKAYMSAETRYRNILQNYPAFPEKDKLYFNLAKAQYHLGNMDDGKVWLEKLLHDWPNSEYTAIATRFLDQKAIQGIQKQDEARQRKEEKAAKRRVEQRRKQMEKARKKYEKNQAKTKTAEGDRN